RDGARAGGERANVAVGAPDLCEQAPILGIRAPTARRRSEGARERPEPDVRVPKPRRRGEGVDEVSETLDIFEIVVVARDGIAGEQRTVTLRAVLVREQRRGDPHLVE